MIGNCHFSAITLLNRT